MPRPNRLPISVAVTVATAAALVALIALPSAAGAQSPYPHRDGIVANGTDMALSVERINNDFHERIGDPYALDGLALIVDDCHPDPEVYLDLALVHYGLAPRAGAINNDALAWLVCMDPRFVGLFFASDNDFADALDHEQATDAMVDDLRDENFTGAFTGSIEEVANQLAASSHMPEESVGADVASPPVRSDGDDGGGGRARWLLPLLAVAAAGVVFWGWRRRAKPAVEPAEKAAVPSPLKELDGKLAELNVRLTDTSPSQARLVLAYESKGDKAILTLNDRHEKMVGRLAALNRQAKALKDSHDVGGVDKDREESLWAPPIAEADALLRYVDDLDAEAEHVAMLKERAPILAVEAREAIEAARELYGADIADLDLPTADDALAYAVELTDAAEAALTAGDRITSGMLSEDAAEIAERSGALPGRIRQADATIEETSILFERLGAYAESSWSDIRGNGSEADESLDAAVDMFQRIVAADRDAFGADSGAGYLASLGEVDRELDRATRLVTAVADRFAFLQNAAETAPSAIVGVQGEIDDGQAWLAQPDVDADVGETPVEKLAEAERLLADARLESAAPKPDWVVVLRKVNEADQAADQALAAARKQRDQVQARVRQVDAARTDARAGLSRAERFLESHRADATAPSVEQVGEARSMLARAEDRSQSADQLQDTARADALLEVTAAFEQAGRQAQSAYDALASDVARAEEKRRQYVPRPNWMGPTVPMPMDLRPMPRIGGSKSGWKSRPKRKSSWGSRPKSSGSRVRKSGSSSRRGGGRGW